MARSIAQEAQICDPWGCGLNKGMANTYWRRSHFIDTEGNTHMAYAVSYHGGILSVTFADGSILCMDHWKG